MEEVIFKNISVTDAGFVLFLNSKKRDLMLPIFVGLVEAQGIANIMNNERTKRPMTYDLVLNLFKEVKCEFKKVEIIRSVENTYFANTYFHYQGKEIILDSRPSDGIIFSLLSNKKIYVDISIMNKSGINIENGKEFERNVFKDTKNSNEKNKGLSKNKNDELGVYWKLLEEAIREERYEDASKIKRRIDFIMEDNDIIN